MTDDARPEGGYTLVEMLVAVAIAGVIAAVLGAAFIISTKTTVQASTRLRESHDAQLLTAYFRDDAASASYVSDSAVPGSCAYGDLSGATPVALFSWTEAGAARNALYLRSSTDLVRRYCEAGVKKYDVTVARNLSTAATAATLTCPPLAGCVPSPAQMQLNITERSGYTYALQATPRTDPLSGGGLGAMSFYVGGGGIDLGGDSTLTSSGLGYISGTITCNGNSSTKPTATAGLYTSGDSTCGSPSVTAPVPDPLLSVPEPAEPTQLDPAQSATATCVAGKPTFQPGTYTTPNKTLSDGCLASGVYYFRNGATLDNVTAASAGVLIYVKSGDLLLSGSNVGLRPLADPKYAGVTIFLGRANSGQITVSSPSTVDGVIYAPAGTLHIQTPNNSPLHAGGIDVKTLELQANVDAFTA